MTDENTTAVVTPSAEEIRARLVVDLDLAALSPKEQDDIIIELSEVLVERVGLNVFAKIPEDVLTQIDTLLEEGKQEEANTLLLQVVPDAPAIAEKTINDGIAEYKARVAGTYAEVAE